MTTQNTAPLDPYSIEIAALVRQAASELGTQAYPTALKALERKGLSSGAIIALLAKELGTACRPVARKLRNLPNE
jgi:hypothetical protein